LASPGSPGGVSQGPKRAPRPQIPRFRGIPDPDPLREGGFTSTPRAGAPRFPGTRNPQNARKRAKTRKMGKNAQIRGFPGISRKMAKNGLFSGISGFLGFSAPGYRGAPARGVDVKPPSRRGLGSGKPRNRGFGGPEASGGLPGTPGGAPGGPGKALRSPGAPDGVPEPVPGQGFYINPSRRGPAVPGAGPSGPGVPGPPRGPPGGPTPRPKGARYRGAKKLER